MIRNSDLKDLIESQAAQILKNNDVYVKFLKEWEKFKVVETQVDIDLICFTMQLRILLERSFIGSSNYDEMFNTHVEIGLGDMVLPARLLGYNVKTGRDYISEHLRWIMECTLVIEYDLFDIKRDCSLFNAREQGGYKVRKKSREFENYSTLKKNIFEWIDIDD